MCLSIFLRRGAAASATIYPCVECASSRSVFYCITLYRNELSYATIECTLCEHSIVINCIKKNPAKQDSPPAAGRVSDILPFRRSAILAERFSFIGRIFL